MYKKLNLLVVDDNPADSNLLGRYLHELSGWDVHLLSCETGEQALKKMRERDPDICIVDYLLGAETGTEVIRRMKEAGSNAAFILLTGRGDEHVAIEALRGGISDYLTKSELSPGSLERSLRHVIDRKQAEKTIGHQVEFHKKVLESLDHPFYVIDANDYTVIEANSATGFGSLSGKPKCYALTHKSNEPCKEPKDICPLKEIKKTKKPFTVEHLHYDKDGNVRNVEVHAYPIFDSEENVIQMIEYTLDITDRKKMEEERLRLATAIKQVADIIVITDAEPKIMYANPAFERITGYSVEEALGQNPRFLQSGKHEKAFYKEMWETISSGNVWSGHFINRKKDGTLYEEEATISPVFDPSGKIINYVAVKRDVTSEAMLTRARRHFTSVTSHELRTPQTKLKLVETLIKNLKADEIEQGKRDVILSILGESSLDFDRVISATTLLAELSVPQTKKNLNVYYLHESLESSLENARTRLEKEKRNINTVLNTDSLPAGASVLGNREMIMRVFEEILSNAFKYTPDGKNVFVIGKMEEDYAIIDISDEGPGIPRDQREQVFEPYFSLEDFLRHSTGRYKYMGGGIGLGLTISRLIMDYHNGKLEIESGGEKQGTTVTLRFPLVSKSI